MRTEHDESVRGGYQFPVIFVVLYFNPEFSACIESETVQHDLSEPEMARIYGTQSPEWAIPEPPAEEIFDSKIILPVDEHVENDDNRHDGIENPDVDPAEQEDQ